MPPRLPTDPTRRWKRKVLAAHQADEELDESGRSSRRSDVSGGGRRLAPPRRGGRRERASSRGSMTDAEGSEAGDGGSTRRSKMQKYIQDKLKKKGVVDA